MAVVPNAEPIDATLDLLGRLTEIPRPMPYEDQLIAASAIAGLWELVAKHALATNDPHLLTVAAREWKHARDTFAALDPP